MFERNGTYVSTLAILGCLSMGAACGGSAEQKKVAVVAPVDLQAKVDVPVVPMLQLPAKIEHLIDVVPEDAVIAVHVDVPMFFDPRKNSGMGAFLPDLVAPKLAESTGLSRGFLLDFMPKVKAAMLFVVHGGAGSKPLMPVCFGLELQDEKQFDALLEQLAGHKNPDGTWEATQGEDTTHGAWIAASNTTLICETDTVLKTALDVGLGKAPSFVTSKRFLADGPAGTWLSFDLHRFSPDSHNTFEDGSYAFASIPQKDPSHVELRFVGRGQMYPQLADTIVPTNHPDLAKFPLGATTLLAFSTGRFPGRSLSGIVNELARSGAVQPAEVLDRALNEMGTDIQEMDGLLGGEVTLGLYGDPKFPTTQAEILLHKGMLVAVRTANEATSKKLWRVVTGKIKEKKSGPKVTFAADSMTIELRDGNVARVERRNGILLLGIGEKTFTGELVSQFDKPKNSYASNADFEAARIAAKPSHLMSFIDVPKMDRLTGESPQADLLKLVVEKPNFLTMTLAPTPGSLDISLHSPFTTGGVVTGLGVFAVNRYLKATKVSEAKNAVGRIARGAQEGFEREDSSGGHALCGAAKAVPSFVPKGTKYTPEKQPGKDFLTGDAQNGWRCLRFETQEPLRYQLEYRVGGNYKGPARGGPDPGPDGFEASAEGDLDGNGKTSLFTITGQIQKQSGMLVRATQIFVADEME